MYTPWGYSQQSTRYRCGALSVSTASHGGFLLPAGELAARVPSLARARCAIRTAAGDWYEEDCAWCVAVLAVPELRLELEAEARRWVAEIRSRLAPNPSLPDPADVERQYAEAELVRSVTFWYGPALVELLGYVPDAEAAARWRERVHDRTRRAVASLDGAR